jgi:hypothetical protein
VEIGGGENLLRRGVAIGFVADAIQNLLDKTFAIVYNNFIVAIIQRGRYD